jgi:hypothetical protein
MSSAKDHNTVTNICNKSCTTSCNTVNSNNFDSSCNKIEVEICEDDQICQPLINELYKIPSNYVCVYNINVESDKSIRHKQLMKAKFVYPRVDPPPSEIVDNRNDDEKMASIIRTCQQILTKDELDCWNSLCERYLQNSTRYVSGIPKIRADMLKEIKDFRISEQEKQKLADNLEKVPFHDFTNYKELLSNSDQKIQNNQNDTIDHLSALKDPIDQTEEHPLQVPLQGPKTKSWRFKQHKMKS